jgi:transposase
MLQFTFAGFEIQHITSREAVLTIMARALSTVEICPTCGMATSHMHSYYTRSPQDLPISGQQVQLMLRMRRFRCLNPQCPRQTFAERLPELPVSARQTSRLGTILESIAVVLSGQAGSRLAEQLAMPVSADTLLRRAKKKAPMLPTPRTLGVDDFAFRRGHTYGTILIDLETHQPVDLLEDRSAETEARMAQATPWRGNHQPRSWQGIPAWSNGWRSTGTSRVIDRWHLLKNLRETIERFLSHTQMPEEANGGISPRQKRTSGERARVSGIARSALGARIAQVVELSKQGGTIQGIARRLQISRQTVRKFVQAPSFPEFQRVPRYARAPLTSIVRICENEGRAGSRTTDQLWKELQERGFSGSWMMVYRWVQLQNDAVAGSADQLQPQTPATAKRMAPRHLAWLLLRDPEHLEKQEQQQLALRASGEKRRSGLWIGSAVCGHGQRTQHYAAGYLALGLPTERDQCAF